MMDPETGYSEPEYDADAERAEHELLAHSDLDTLDFSAYDDFDAFDRKNDSQRRREAA